MFVCVCYHIIHALPLSFAVRLLALSRNATLIEASDKWHWLCLHNDYLAGRWAAEACAAWVLLLLLEWVGLFICLDLP